MRTKNVFACQTCGYQSPKWLGRCPDCGAWNSFVEEASPDRGAAAGVTDASVEHYPEIREQEEPRIVTGNPEFDRVLGGGLVPGSVVLLGPSLPDGTLQQPTRLPSLVRVTPAAVPPSR